MTDAPSFKRPVSPAKCVVAEGLGTGFLLLALVGAGALAEGATGASPSLTLLISALATSAMLYALIATLSEVSGAHLNPAVTLALACRGEISVRLGLAYVCAQIAGAVAGVVMANALSGAELVSISMKQRTGGVVWLSELVCTFGLVGLIMLCSKLKKSQLPLVVAAYIGACFFFSPTGFANPAVSIARAITDTFSGIRLADVPAFVVAQTLGAAAAVLLFSWLLAGHSVRNTSEH